jgi:AcrR family transcriptional regulator
MAKQDTRERIMEASVDLFARYGFKKTTVDDIAKESGIGKGTVYLHFSSKEDIALEVMRDQNRQIHDKLRSIASGKAASESKLRSMLVTRVMERFDRIQNFVSSIDDFMGRAKGPYDALRKRVEREEAEIFAEVLIEGRLQGDFVLDEPFPTAEAMIAATNGLMPTVLSRMDLNNRSEVEDRAKRIASLLLFGIASKRA